MVFISHMTFGCVFGACISLNCSLVAEKFVDKYLVALAPRGVRRGVGRWRPLLHAVNLLPLLEVLVLVLRPRGSAAVGDGGDLGVEHLARQAQLLRRPLRRLRPHVELLLLLLLSLKFL